MEHPKPKDRRFKDKTGMKFGRLTVTYYAGRRPLPGGQRTTWWGCRCQCGNVVEVRGSNLQQKHTTSCGCLVKEMIRDRCVTHGQSNTKMFMRWDSMCQRCQNPNHRQYARYGGRGIKVCKRWLKFENFYTDMGDPPTDEHSLDRIDNDGDYKPSNCRWATHAEQQRNKENNRIITVDGESRCVAEWAEITGIKETTLLQRLQRGWSDERTVNTPVRKMRSFVRGGRVCGGATDSLET